MINKRIKAGILKAKKPSKNIKFGPGVAALMLFCLMLLVTSVFIQIKPNFNLPNLSFASVLNFEYIPQIPAVIFTAALLGRTFGIFTILLYVLLGLSPWFPVFALGGGADYIFQYSFGFIAAFIPAVYFSAGGFKNSSSFINQLLAVLYGIFIIHITGIIYITITAFLKHDSPAFLYDLIFYMSLSKIIYDIIFSFIAVILAKLLKKIIWIIL